MRRKRLDGVSEVVTKPVEISRLVEPKFLTLVGRPANQIGFKVVRSDSNGEGDMPTSDQKPTEPVRVRRIRSTQRSALLYIEFPEGATDEDVEALTEEYGLEGYSTTETADGRKCLTRSDLATLPADAITVMIGGGLRAGIARGDAIVQATADPLPGISLVAIEFTSRTDAEAIAYLRRYDIDFPDKGVENTETGVTVHRSEVSDGQDIRRVEIEAGVVAVVTRSALSDLGTLNTDFIGVVTDSTYGNWGWGHLDFASAMADVEFCNAAENASRRLRDVVDNIIFFSPLPVNVRKELIVRASSQFAGYMGALLDALPAKVVLVNRSNLEKQTMTGKVEDAAKPNAQPAGELQAAAVPANAGTGEFVTRSELTSLIGEAIATALKATQPAETVAVTRSEETATPAKGNEEQTTLLAQVEEVVTRSVGTLATAVNTVNDRLAAIEGATALRSDSADGGAAKPKDPFAGVFSRTK